MDSIPLIPRDVSWLSFNHRVLQEAMDQSVPLYERIKFLAIYSSNLDEFFRVRVASLRSFKDLKKKTRKALPVKPKKELKQIRKIVQQQQEVFGRVFREEIIPALQKNGVYLHGNEDYSSPQKEFARQYFFEKVYPLLNPVFMEDNAPPPFLKNKELYFIVAFPKDSKLALVEIPAADLSRFLVLPGEAEEKHFISFLDDIIRQNLEALFSRPIDGAYAIKLSRDAEIYIDDEFSGDLVKKIKKGLENRKIGLPTRFLYDSSMPKEVLDRLKQVFGLTKNDLIPGARYHNFNDFFGFPNPTQDTGLHDEPLPPLPHPILETTDDMFQTLREQDVMLHFPYQRYDYIPRLILEAATDPQVRSIKITLYRAAAKSMIVEALMNAIDQGKEVVVFIEAKARFDEAANLYWGNELVKAGAEVRYSYPGIKVHTKLLLIGREEEGQVRYYTYLGTGNFNEKTAKLYCDHALLTAEQKLAKEVEQVFALLERRIIIPKCKHLFMSPFTTRDKFVELIDREIALAKAGKKAYMILKMNSLEDPGMIAKLYESSRAGVDVKIIVRGICCLQPGLKELSEHIEVISIIDRFLEHARVYIFGNDGRELMYTASADWMTRNLDRRVEVVMPIYNEAVFRELRHIIDLQLQDNQKARLINARQDNPYKEIRPEEGTVRAQTAIYAYLKNNM